MKKNLFLIFVTATTLLNLTSLSQAHNCTREYIPVCGLVQVQCFTTPCPPLLMDFSNACLAKAAGSVEQRLGKCGALEGTAGTVGKKTTLARSYPARVEQLSLLVATSQPPQYILRVTGQLMNGCETLGEPAQQKLGNDFIVSLPAGVPIEREGMMCSMALRPFETQIKLDVPPEQDMSKPFSVIVNGRRTQFGK